MSALQPFHLADALLQPGVTLIEASAGTGKTFTIAGIVLRLVIEERVPIEQILAVTYTIAATEELRDRVRRRLYSALDDLRQEKSSDEILAKFLKTGKVEQGIRDLDLAVQNFDEAQIFTIHGFCQRVLRANAFESGVLFDMELLADPSSIFDEVAHDFWRMQFYQGSPLLSRLAMAEGLSPGDWAELLDRIRNHPDLRILPDSEAASSAKISKKLETAFNAICEEWKKCGRAVREMIEKDRGLSRNKSSSHFSPDKCGELMESLGAVCTDFTRANPECLKALEKLSRSHIEQCTKPTGTAPEHRFFDLCEDFRALASRFFNKLNHEFIDFAQRELPLRKGRLNVLTYDDLLTRLRDALNGGSGEALAKTLGTQYRAALIDEFQDTDPIQYEIFRRVFADGEHHLFFIGDPKQAIYGFRGADVFTYLRAAEGASRGFTLGTNWRSEKPLLDAVNKLFGSVPQPFLMEQIAYRPVNPPQKPREGFATLSETNPQPPLRFRLLQSNDGPLSHGDAEPLICRAVVADIARLKASGARFQNRPLRFGDMAVLVRSNAQAANFQELLRSSGIKSVLRTEESVFQSKEACEVLRLLEAIQEPGRDVLLKTALVTSVFGLRAADIMALDADQARWQEWLEKFLTYRSLWEDSCFISLFRHVFIDQKVRENVVKWPGGERKLTNFLHLAELLHTAETDQRLTPEALCAWLRKQRNDSGDAQEDHQLRLESDDDAVLLATVHKSKGLEYPIVFCPFLWKPGDSWHRSEVLFHDPAADNRLTLDLRDKKEVPENDRRAGEERMAESLRVLYVALTRAQNRCYVYAGDIKGFDSSPLAHVIGAATAQPVLKTLAQKSGGTISVTTIDPEADQTVKAQGGEEKIDHEFRARPFTGVIPDDKMIASFTGLVSERAEEEPDRDAVEPGEEPIPETGAMVDLAGFERGVRAGVFFHDVLEHLDFQTPEQIEKLIPLKLAIHGIPAGVWREPLCAQLQRLLETPLAPGLTLSRIPPANRLSEVEFFHPIASLRPQQLKELFRTHSGAALPPEFPASLGRLQFRPVEGFMRGFMDLLFQFEGRYYLVDWKSNWLGDHLIDYGDAGVRACMLQHSYFLQYHLYAVATDLFLSRRIPDYDYDKHFGGVFYIFLRGVDPKNADRGIFRDRPNVSLVHALRQTLIGGSS